MSSKEKELEKLYDELDALEDEIRYTKGRIEELEDELEDELEGEMCETCNGSGEGLYDVTTCWRCLGKGVV